MPKRKPTAHDRDITDSLMRLPNGRYQIRIERLGVSKHPQKPEGPLELFSPITRIIIDPLSRVLSERD